MKYQFSPIRPLAIVLVPGFGIGNSINSNPFFKAKTPYFDELAGKSQFLKLHSEDISYKKDSKELLESGLSQMSLGVLHQSISTRIENSIKSKNLEENEVFRKIFIQAQENKSNTHLIVSAHNFNILKSIVKAYSACGFNTNKLIFHFILDTKLDASKACKEFGEIVAYLHKFKMEAISSIIPQKLLVSSGKLQNEQVYKTLLKSSDNILESWQEFFKKDNYQKNNCFSILNFDEVFESISHEDSIVFVNTNHDIFTELMKYFISQDGSDKNTKLHNLNLLALIEQDEVEIQFVFPKFRYSNSLSELIFKNGLKQLKLFFKHSKNNFLKFFEGRTEKLFGGEDWLEIEIDESIKNLIILKKQLQVIFSQAIKKIKTNQYDVIILDISLPEDILCQQDFNQIVGYIEELDSNFKCLATEVLNLNGAVILASPNSGLEQVYKTNYETEITDFNPCVFFFDKQYAQEFKFRDGKLIDFAPTILKLLGIQKPSSLEAEPLF